MTEEEDELWSSLPENVLATHNETFKILQAKWAVTSERLAQLDRDLDEKKVW